MKDVTPLIFKYQRQISSQVLGGKDIFTCPDETRNYINILAEVYAYVDSVIPKALAGLSIFDFDGMVREKAEAVNISPEVVCLARDELCRYCWGKPYYRIIPLQKDPSCDAKMLMMSRMSKRREKCRNVVIYGESPWAVGRSFSASLIMKEAIKTRMRAGHSTQTYDWIDFGQIVKMAFSKDPEDESSLDNYCNRDWIVVDDIIKLGAYPQRPNYYSNQFKYRIHDFFNTRYASNKVTIFVFRYNVKEVLGEIEEWYGHSVNTILQDNFTCNITLSKKD